MFGRKRRWKVCLGVEVVELVMVELRMRMCFPLLYLIDWLIGDFVFCEGCFKVYGYTTLCQLFWMELVMRSISVIRLPTDCFFSGRCLS